MRQKKSIGLKPPAPCRGDIWFADLGNHTGTSVQGGCRPVLVISNDTANIHAETVNVVPLTRHLKKPGLPCHMILDSGDVVDSKQSLDDSMLLAEQITTIGKPQLRSYVGRVENKEVLAQIMIRRFIISITASMVWRSKANVNTYESRGTHNVRQKGFQEAEIVDMVAGVTKYVKKINKAEEVKESLETAIRMMSEGRPGPCLLDIAMDVTRGDIEPNFSIRSCDEEESDNLNLDAVFAALRQAERPVLLLGNGIHICGCEKLIVQLVQKLKMPVLTSLPASDLLSYCVPYSQGFIGAYGKRSANIILEKSDLVMGTL